MRRLFILTLAAAALFICRSAIHGKRRFRSLRGGPPPLHTCWHRIEKGCVFSRHVAPEGEQAGLPIVMVHGLGVSGAYFIPLAERLACRYPVLIPDLPGHGVSDSPRQSMDIADLSQALLDWLDKVGIKRCALVGQSMGAQIAIEASLQQPQRFAGLVLIGPTGDPRAGLLLHAGRLLRVAPFERLSLFFIVLKDYLRMGWRLIPECRAMLADPVYGKLERVHMPVMLIKGEKDAVSSDDWFAILARGLPTYCASTVAGAAHAVHYSMPGAVAAALYPYLRRLSESKEEAIGKEGRAALMPMSD